MVAKPLIDQQKLTNWYNFQARFYHLWRDDYSSPILDDVARELGSAEQELAVLDAGCGTGWLAIGLARIHGRWRLEGLDAAEGMLEVARRQAGRFGLDNARFRCADITAIPCDDGSFDVIVAAGLFPNLNEWGGAFREFIRVLKPAGRLVVVELDRASMSPIMKTFVHVMIFGYQVLSTFVPRFRFARRWSLSASTIDRPVLSREAEAAGFREGRSSSRGNNLILVFDKGSS